MTTAQLTTILDLDGTSSHIDGPNCWNGALYINGLVHAKRFTHPNEWLSLLQENCLEVETPQRGDIGRIYNHLNNTEVHGFIYLSRNSIFAKHGESTRDGYQIMTTTEMMKQYGKTRDCRVSGEETPECFHLIKYYRCQATSDVTFKTFDLLLEELIFSEQTKRQGVADCSSEHYFKREEIVRQMIHLLTNSSEQISLPRKISYQKQLSNIKVNYRTSFRCEDRKKRDENINRLIQLIRTYSSISP